MMPPLDLNLTKNLLTDLYFVIAFWLGRKKGVGGKFNYFLLIF